MSEHFIRNKHFIFYRNADMAIFPTICIDRKVICFMWLRFRIVFYDDRRFDFHDRF